MTRRQPQSTEVMPDGTKVWRNPAGQRHNLDGPAVEYADGTKEFWIKGEQHTEAEFNGLRPKRWT